MSEAEVIVDASNCVITVRGNQAFVSEILEKYRFVLEQAPKVQPKQEHKTIPQEDQKGASPKHASGDLSSLDNIYDLDGDAISILVSPPGKSITAQAKALILLYLYARLQMGEPSVPAEGIKEQCKSHACYDSKNFVAHLKGQKNLVTVTGANATLAARLTVPGRKAAEELAQSLQGTG